MSRLVHEVDAFRTDSGLEGRVGTFLDISNDEARRDLWSDHLEWIDLPGESIEERSRSLEVFLDTVGAYASDDNTWLLDERSPDSSLGLLRKPQPRRGTFTGSFLELMRSPRCGTRCAPWG